MFSQEALLKELDFKAIRSSGSGGQHVNKVSSKVELTFSIVNSIVFNESQKERLQSKLKHRLTKDDVLILQCDESRSQHKNKELVVKRFLALIKSSLVIPKRRIPTKIPKQLLEND